MMLVKLSINDLLHQHQKIEQISGIFLIPGYLGISRDISGYLVDILKHHQHNRALNESQKLKG